MAFFKKLLGVEEEKDKLDFQKINLQTLAPLEVANMIEVCFFAWFCVMVCLNAFECVVFVFVLLL